MGEKRKVYKVLVGKPEVRRPLGRPRRRWEDGVRMDLRSIINHGLIRSDQNWLIEGIRLNYSGCRTKVKRMKITREM
jgi:hypothetical protein